MIRGDVFFTPEFYWDGLYRPVCFNDMEGAESVADAVCLAAGFNGGARVVREAGKTFDRDAMPVVISSLSHPLPPSSFSFFLLFVVFTNFVFFFIARFVNVPLESLFPAAWKLKMKLAWRFPPCAKQEMQ
jgi:hypothetical protein